MWSGLENIMCTVPRKEKSRRLHLFVFNVFHSLEIKTFEMSSDFHIISEKLT